MYRQRHHEITDKAVMRAVVLILVRRRSGKGSWGKTGNKIMGWLLSSAFSILYMNLGVITALPSSPKYLLCIEYGVRGTRTQFQSYPAEAGWAAGAPTCHHPL